MESIGDPSFYLKKKKTKLWHFRSPKHQTDTPTMTQQPKTFFSAGQFHDAKSESDAASNVGGGRLIPEHIFRQLSVPEIIHAYYVRQLVSKHED